MMHMTAEAKVKFAAFYEKMTRMIEEGWKDAPPQIKEFKQLLEKMTNDLYSKIKATA
jgi:hypothetical protein